MLIICFFETRNRETLYSVDKFTPFINLMNGEPFWYLLMVRLQLDPFLNELTSMFQHTTEKGSVWVTLKHSFDKSKVQLNKIATAGKEAEYKCLIRATDGKKNISTLVGTKDHQRFQAATILKARMTSLKKREKKDRRKSADAADKKQEVSKMRSTTASKP